ncbi:hypothetical protein LIER_06543 [Lithospermum erythrorhizon]|uniref:Uncharacterized protein n=1 Tax=Lithospermum erythrorhizon TaxID=34254 RepID=A0AAV3P9G9_LITER
MLYSEKPGKVSRTRWHRYMFLVKGAFSDNVPHQFRMDYTTLEFEEFGALEAEFQKLIDGFPQPLPLKTFCDPDVVIKVGMCQGPNRFPDMTVGDFLLCKLETALIPGQVNYKAIISGGSLKQRVLGSKDPRPIPSSSKEKLEEPTSDQGVKDALENIEALVQEETREKPLDSSPVQYIWFPGKPP